MFPVALRNQDHVMGKLQPKPKPDEVGLCMLSLHIYNSFKIYKPESELLTTLK